MKLLLKQELIPIPENTTVKVEKKVITINGLKYSRILDLSHLNLFIDTIEGNVRVRLWNSCSKEQSKVNTCASVIRNAINGCVYGYRYILKAASKHFPIALEIEEAGKKVHVKNFLGEKNTRKFKMINNSVAKLGEEKDTLVIEGESIEDVSQSAGMIVKNCMPKGYDSRVFLDGIYVMKKGLIEN